MNKGKWVGDEMTVEEAAIFAINAFGKGQHPVASAKNLDRFTQPYVVECLNKAAASDRVYDEAKVVIKRAITHYS